MDFITPFFFLGAFKLVYQAFEDMKAREIDYASIQFMTGIVIFLYLISNRWIEGIIILVIATLGLNFLKNNDWVKTNLIGLEDGDILTLVWVLGGMWLFGFVATTFFIGFYVLFLYAMYTKKINNIPVLVPITVSFILVWVLQSIKLL